MLKHGWAVPKATTLFPAGTPVFLFGDSINYLNQYQFNGAGTDESSLSSRGDWFWVQFLDQRVRLEDWRDLTRNVGPYSTQSGTLANNPFATSSGSATVTVTKASHGFGVLTAYTGGAEYVFAGASTFNNVTLNGGYKVLTVPSSSTFTITAGTTANASSSGGGASVTYILRGASAVPPWLGAGSNWAISSDHSEGTLDLLQSGNGFPSSNIFTLAGITGLSRAIAVLNVGTNDINSSNSFANFSPNITAVVDRLVALGFGKIIVNNARPRGLPEVHNLPNNPFTTTNGSAIVTVSNPAQRMDDNQSIVITGASGTVGGLTMNGSYNGATASANTTLTSPDAFTFNAGQGNASSGATGGGASCVMTTSSNNFIYPYDDARWAVRKTYNDWLATTFAAYPTVTVLDFDAVELDGTQEVNAAHATGTAKAQYRVDAVHPSPLASYYSAKNLIIPALSNLVTAVSGDPWFGAVDPTSGTNMFPNPGLAGSAGAKTIVTGSVADSWAATITGANMTGVASVENISTGINRQKFVLTTAAAGTANTLETLIFKPGATIGYGFSGTGKVATVTIVSSGLNPIISIPHSGLSNGAPIPGGHITLSNIVGGTLNGVDLAGTWTCSTVSIPSSNVTYTFVATGQTASGTGSGSRTFDWTMTAANLAPLESWVRFYAYLEFSASTQWRGCEMNITSRSGTTTTVEIFKTGRNYGVTTRRYFPPDALTGWYVSNAIKLDAAEAMASVTNLNPLLFTLTVAQEAATSLTFSVSRPCFRPITDPTAYWAAIP